MSYEYIARRLAARGDLSSAVASLERSYALVEATAAQNPADTRFWAQLAGTVDALLPIAPRVWGASRSVDFVKHMKDTLPAHPTYIAAIPQMASAEAKMHWTMAEMLGSAPAANEERAAACNGFRRSAREWDQRKDVGERFRPWIDMVKESLRNCAD